VLDTVNCQCCAALGFPTALSCVRVRRQRAAGRARRPVGLGQLNCLVSVEQARALLVCRGAEIGGGADEELLDQRRARSRARRGVFSYAWMTSGGPAGDERRGLRWCRALLHVGWLPNEIGATRRIRAGVARGEAQVARGDQIKCVAGLVETAGAQRADFVIQPAGRREIPLQRVVRLGVEAEVVDAPTEITLGSVAGEPIVLNGPASPDDTVTVTPAATAASSNCLVASKR